MDDLLLAKKQAMDRPAWSRQPALKANSSALHTQLKAAGDLGVAVVGVGLLYQQGYFLQVIDKDGAQLFIPKMTEHLQRRSQRPGIAFVRSIPGGY